MVPTQAVNILELPDPFLPPAHQYREGKGSATPDYSWS